MQFPELPLDTPEDPVNFYWEDVAFELPNAASLATWLEQVASAESKPLFDLQVVFCSDEHLRQINVEHLDHDYYTDIITFPYAEDVVHGDLFISADRVRDNAATQGVAFEQELARVMAHGVLHLCGYGDKSPEEVVIMRAKEDHYLQMLNQ